MSGLIDTNILLYAANKDSAEHGVAIDFLSGCVSGTDAWYLTEGIVYEFLRVSTHPRVFGSPLNWRSAMQYLSVIIERDNVFVLTAGLEHWSVLGEILEQIRRPEGNLFFDIRTYTLMREHAVRTVYTADSDFLQFEDITVVNPMRP